MTITVTSVNDGPDIDNETFTIPENSPNNTIVGTVDADDVDDSNLSFSILAGNTGGAFSINASTGQIRVANSAALDFETTPQFLLTVSVDDGDSDAEATITINLTDGPEPPELVSGPGSPSFTEGGAAVVVDGNIAVTDDETNLESATVTITNLLDGASETLAANTGGTSITASYIGGVLTLTGTDTVVNYQAVLRSVTYANSSDNPTTTARSISFVVNDGDADSNTVPKSVAIVAVNDAPVNAVPGGQTTNEDTALTFSTGNGNAISISDVDGSSSVVTLAAANGSITASAGATISGNGTANVQLSGTNAAINTSLQGLVFNPTPNFNGAGAQITVTTNDQGNTGMGGAQSDVDVIAINVLAVNDQPVVNAATFSLDESSANLTAVGTVTFSDNDPGDTHTFAITAGNTGGAFAINASTGAITVANSAALDFETTPTFSLTVTVTDDSAAGNAAGSGTITVNLNNVNEVPVNAVPAAQTTNEDTALTFTVGGGNGIQIADVDAGANPLQVTLAVTNGTLTADTGATISNNNTANVTLTGTIANINASLDGLIFNPTPNFNGLAQLTITTNDQGNTGSGGALQDVDTVDITVLAINDQPVVNAATFSLDENSANLTAVGTVTFTDNDPGDTHTFAITAGNTGGAFAINASTGAITVANMAALDFETNPTFSLTVTVTDDSGAGNATGSATVTIDLNDLNEAPVANDATFNLDENSANGTVVGTVTATDQDASQTLTYAITAGNTGGAFAINPSTGAITVNDVNDVNFEVNPTFSLTVTVTDNGTGNLSDTATITVNLNNLNEAPVVDPATVAINENSANGTSVHTVTFTEPDTTGQTHSFAITGGNALGAFAINASTGEITVADVTDLDFETNPTFSLTVQVTDIGAPTPNLSGTATITINLNDVNDAPVINDQSFSVDENSANTTVVGTVTATDQDAGQTLTYAITGGNALGAFTINASSGQITVADFTDLDFETNPTFNLTVQVTDNGTGNLTDTATITINLNNLNEAPVVNAAGPFALAENSANTTVVFTATATDPDSGQTLTYAITAGNTGGAFAINPSSGQVTVANSAAVDFETNPTFTLTVQVTDNGTPSLNDTENFTINITNVNEAPDVNPATFSLPENSPNGTVVGTVTFTDQDTGQTHSFAITGGNALGAFAINPSTGEITVADVTDLDFETNPTFTLTVEVTDNGVPFLSGSDTITINLTDANEPPVVNDQSFNVDENSANGTVVGSIAFSDPDGPSDTFAIIAGNAGGEFAVHPTTGVITVTNTLNFEVAASYVFTIEITDGGTPIGTDTAQITININNLNEPPVVNAAGPFSLAENSANGTNVGTPITFTEPDTTGQTHTYSITGGNTGGAFAIDNSGQITVANVTAVNFETNPTFTLTVTVTDAGLPNPANQAGSTNVTINLTNMNDAPVVNDQSFNVMENSSIGTVVGTVVATEEDSGQSLTYSITAGNTGGAFAINPGNGQITVANPINYESLSSYSLTVQVQDNGAGNLTDTATITITVLDLNEAPVVNDQSFNVDENVSTGTVVGSVVASDPDMGQMLTYSITAGNTGGAFAINPGNGQITVANPINFESVASYSLTVQVQDNGAGTLNDTATVTINVNNLNEAPVVNAAGPFTLAENSPNSTNVGTPITYTEPDTTGQTHTYSITGGNTGGAFAIDNSGQITVANVTAVNYETNPTFTLTVTVTDAGPPNPPNQGGSTNVTINLTDVNDAPVYSDAARSIAENSSVGTNVGLPVTAIDEDIPAQTLTYSIIGGNTGNVFAINGSTGQITVNGAINFEGPDDPYALTVQVTDNGTPNLSDTATVTVTVTDVNEAPVLPDASRSINENSANGTNVGAVLPFTDEDTGQSYTFAITAGNGGGAFAISNTGQITVANSTLLNFEVTPSFSLTVQITDNGTPNLSDTATVTVTVVDLNEAPTAVADTYNAVGGTLVQIAGLPLPSPTPVATTGDVHTTPRTTGVKANDTDPDTNPLFNNLTVTFVTGNAGAVAVPGAGQATTTTTNGSVTMHSNGSFHYTPNAGYLGGDSFTYTINDAANNATGVVNFTVHAPAIRYVKNNAPSAGNGTSATPHQTLAAAIAASTAGELIYVMEGDGTNANHGGSNLMKANQMLWGQGVALSVTANSVPLTLINATNKPLIGPSGSANETIRILNVSGVDVQGLSIDGGTTNAIDLTTSGASAGGFSASNNTISAATLQGIDVNHASSGTAIAVVQSNTITSTGDGFHYARTSTGTGTIVFSSNTVTSGAAGVNISGGLVTATTITGFTNNNITGNTAGTGVNISTATFDAAVGGTFQTVSGGNTNVGQSGNGVGGRGVVLTTVAGDLSFSTLNIYADGGVGLFASSGAAYTGSAGLQIVANTNNPVIQAAGGPAVDLNTVTINLQPNTISSTNSATTGVSLATVAGTFTAGAGSAIQNAATTDFAISGGTVASTYNGTIYDNAGQLISIANSTGGTKIFAGAIDDLDGTTDPVGGGAANNGGGISLTNNGGTTIRFNGGLELSTGTTTAFSATGGGTVEVCDDAGCDETTAGSLINRIVTTTATALNVASTTIGANGMELRSISSNGGGNAGIVLSATGSSGAGLMVRGNAGSCTSAATCTGGAIQNKTVNGITINDSTDVQLSYMFIDNNDGSGIGGTLATDLVINNSRITNNSDTATGTEAGIRFDAMAGTNSLSNTNVTGSSEDEIRITPTSGSFTLNITGGTFGPNSAVTGGNLISLIGTNTANWTFNVSGTTFTGARASAIMSNMSNTGKGTVSVSGSTFTTNGKGVSIGSSQSADHDFDIDNNNFVDHISNAIEFVSSADATTSSTTRGVINNNDIGDGSLDSGSQNLYGIAVDLRNNGDTTLAITNNNVRNSDFEPIWVSSADFGDAAGGGLLDLTLTNNIGGQPDDNSVAPVGQFYGMLVDVRHTTSACANISGNNGDGLVVEDLRARVRDSAVFRIERLTDGDGTPGEILTTAQTESHLNAENPASSPTDASTFGGATGFTEATNGQCRTWPGL